MFYRDKPPLVGSSIYIYLSAPLICMASMIQIVNTIHVYSLRTLNHYVHVSLCMYTCIHPYVLCVYIFLLFIRFVEHELIVEKEAGTIEWKARKSIQQKEAQEQKEASAASKQTASAAEQVSTEKGKDIRLLEMGGEEASEAETKTAGKHEYTHQLR